MNKASGGDGIPVELFQILKDDAVKVLHSICQGVSGPSSSCVWNPRVFADDARGWQCPFATAEFPNLLAY